MSCPRECSDDRKKLTGDINSLYQMSIPTWVRTILIAGIIALFGMYATGWAYNASTYATKIELRELRNEGRLAREINRKMFEEIINRLPAKTGNR